MWQAWQWYDAVALVGWVLAFALIWAVCELLMGGTPRSRFDRWVTRPGWVLWTLGGGVWVFLHLIGKL